MNGIYKLLPLLVCSVGLVWTGCVSTKPGKVVDSSIEGSREKAGESYDVHPVNTDHKKSGKIHLKVSNRPEYEVQYFEDRVELSRRHTWPGWTAYGVGIVSMLASLPVPDCFSVDTECPSPEKQKEANRAYLLVGIGLGLMISGIAEVIWAENKQEYGPTDGHIREEAYTRTQEGSPQTLSSEPVNLLLNGKKKQYVTDADGQFKVDVAEDFGIRLLEKPLPQQGTVILPEREYTQSISLDPREWMVPYARLQSETPLRTRPSSDAGAAQTAERGEELRILETRNGWVQVRRSGQNGWLSSSDVERFWAVPTRLDPSRPPSVAASVDFSEPSGNDRLDGDETATVRITAHNEGKGPAHRVRAVVSPKTHPHLSYPQSIDFGRINAGQSKMRSIQVEADRQMASKEIALTFRFQEANGFAPSPQRLRFETREFIPPELTVADVGINDASGNGVIEPGELVEVTARVRNASRGAAENVSARVNFGEDVFAGPDTRESFDLGDLGPGKHQDVRFSLLTNQQAESVTVTMDLSESYGEYGTQDIKLPLQFDTPTDQITEVQVEGQETDVAVQTGGTLSVDVETNIPSTPVDRPNAVAVVIGIRSYAAEGVPNVKYARRDARFVRKYLTQTLGFRDENILPRDPDGRMTYGELQTLIQEKLPSYIKEGTSEVFVYYSGHGAPSTGEKRYAYLVPTDTDPSFVSDANAYRLERFYQDLAALDAESVTVALDACFTGQAGSGDMMIRQASPLTLSVENPLLALEDGTAFLASGPEQVANWYPAKKHGLFTYFFLKGLKGDADLNSDRRVTVREMKQYLIDQNDGVPYWSGRVHQRTQTPQVVSQNPDRVLVRYGETEPTGNQE